MMRISQPMHDGEELMDTACAAAQHELHRLSHMQSLGEVRAHYCGQDAAVDASSWSLTEHAGVVRDTVNHR